MTDLINRLREYAVCEEMCPTACRKAMAEAADKLEDMEERLAIMTENLDQTWGESHCTCSGAAVFNPD